MTSMKLAAIQFRPTKGDWERSAAALLALVEEAGRQGADLIVCPEMALTGYLFPTPAAAAQVAEDALTGPTFRSFSPLAWAFHCYLVIGYPEKTADGPLYNSALLLGPDGSLLFNYRKRLLYESDTTWALPGDTPYPLIDTPFGRLTAGICMDLNDDRFTAFLRREQPDVVAFCTNWIHQGVDIRPYWRYRLRGVRSCFVAANTYGSESVPAPTSPTLPTSRYPMGTPPQRSLQSSMSAHFLGFSALLDADGETLRIASEVGDEVLLAEVPCNFPANPRK